jgi:hypothetical protein
MKIVFSVICFFLLVFAGGKNTDALVYLQTDGVYLYFPESEQPLGFSLADQVPDMISFLSRYKLPVKPGLHIVLDDQLDEPDVEVHVIPHLEIRIPIRAPGVLEEGYTESDPWGYFLFKGLCLQGIYVMRGGIPGFLYKGFGEIISPNVIFPPWVHDGICALLYSHYRKKEIRDPFQRMIFHATPPPDLDMISNHPEIWPGHNGFSIYGKPFISWMYDTYGWDRILEFLQVHGEGIIPFEIDLKARKVFEKTGVALWKDFRMAYPRKASRDQGLLISGYCADPFIYWNRSGVYPGKVDTEHRGRYGVAEAGGTLWLSQYQRGISRIYRYSSGVATPVEMGGVWDPGPGSVAVTRKGRSPMIIVFPEEGNGGFGPIGISPPEGVSLVPAPPGILQMSGPVRNDRGHIAVSANLEGNWDIWIYDDRWRRLTTSPSIEMDPWWQDADTLVYTSNMSGTFQIHAQDQSMITRSHHGAMMPRKGTFLELTDQGWIVNTYSAGKIPPVFGETPPAQSAKSEPEGQQRAVMSYHPLKSLWPNYIRPDGFAGVDDFQIGVATKSRDVTGRYLLDGGIRYSFDTNFVAFRAGAQVDRVGGQFVRYPLSYQTNVNVDIEEARNDVKLFWRPMETKERTTMEGLGSTEGLDIHEGLEFSANWRGYKPLEESGPSEDEVWVSAVITKQLGILGAWGNLEFFSEGRQAISGGFNLRFGDKLLTTLHMTAGRTWGDTVLGHNTFRIGGDVAEGYFTRRPSRSFPVRGFDSNLLESSTAAAAGFEVFWPLANLQAGYKTLPLFLHRLQLGTFIDAGAAGESLSRDNLLVGAGIELLTSMEILWGHLSSLRIGFSFPVIQPGDLDEKGPVFVFQLGRPL